MFGRSKKTNDTIDPVDASAQERLPRLDDDHPLWQTPGPRSAAEVDASVGYIDMGAILLPAVKGMQLRTQVADDKKTVLKILLVLGDSGVQISAAAAPRSGGVWDEVRAQIREGLESDGATVTETEGRYGDELYADVPVQMPDGRQATSRMRIIGCEGPRWFSRIDILGPAAQSAEADDRDRKSVV